MIRNEGDNLMWDCRNHRRWRADQLGSGGVVSGPGGYGAAPRSNKYVSTHGFFITINSMILYFKHIHIIVSNQIFLLSVHLHVTLYVNNIFIPLTSIPVDLPNALLGPGTCSSSVRLYALRMSLVHSPHS